ncbi:MAG: class I SAM-dependent methyltransferase [Hyphomicrobiaceae bacterium]
MSDSHAEHLDRNYRYQRHVYDVTREYYLLGRKRLIADLSPPSGGTVLELGCGTALNLVRAQRRYPEARFFGVDLSRMMLATADASLARRGMQDRVCLALGDATSFDPHASFGIDRFDRIFFSYALSMIPPWEAALDHAARLLSPTGRLHIVDFGGCQGLPGFVKRASYAWLAKFRVTPREALSEVTSDLAARHDLTLSFERLYRGYSDYAVLERR